MHLAMGFEGDRGAMGGTGSLARSTGSHCVGHATGWLASASLFATMGVIMCGVKAQKAAATPMRTSARKLEVCCFAYIG